MQRCCNDIATIKQSYLPLLKRQQCGDLFSMRIAACFLYADVYNKLDDELKEMLGNAASAAAAAPAPVEEKSSSDEEEDEEEEEEASEEDTAAGLGALFG